MEQLKPPPNINPMVYWSLLTGGPEIRNDPDRGVHLYWKGQRHYITWWETILLGLRLTDFRAITKKRFNK